MNISPMKIGWKKWLDLKMTNHLVFNSKNYVVKLEGRNQVYNVYNLLGEIVFSRSASAIAFWEVENYLKENE